eukprot:SAG31_NODE_21514_length_547_cov_1.595982_1_plen_63_part_00
MILDVLLVSDHSLAVVTSGGVGNPPPSNDFSKMYGPVQYRYGSVGAELSERCFFKIVNLKCL